MVSIKDYAKEHGVSYEAVRSQVARYMDREVDGFRLSDHISKVGRTQYIDDEGIAFLDERRSRSPIVIQQEERDEDMIYLASNFNLIFDPSAYFSADGTWAYTSLADDILYAEALAMRNTQPGDVLTYIQHWLAFQERFNEILPMIPVYSNIYFDSYTEYLQDYAIDENATWGEAIVAAYLGEPEPAEEEEEAEELVP